MYLRISFKKKFDFKKSENFSKKSGKISQLDLGNLAKDLNKNSSVKLYVISLLN